jgi:hypothetical protein
MIRSRRITPDALSKFAVRATGRPHSASGVGHSGRDIVERGLCWLPALRECIVDGQGDRFGVHFTADLELRELIERARALTSHRLPKGDLASLMKLVLIAFVQQEEKRRFALVKKPRTPPAGTQPGGSASEAKVGTPGPGKRGRHVPAAVRRSLCARPRSVLVRFRGRSTL